MSAACSTVVYPEWLWRVALGAQGRRGRECWAVDSGAVRADSIVMDAADARDIKLSREGDGSAYERLVRRHQQAVARRMAKFTTDRRQLEELTQDVFVEAFFALRSYRGAAPFEHWLMGIATRVGYHFWKQRDRERRREPLPEIPVSVPAADDSVAAVLAKLPARDRIVVTLLYLEERSVAEAAAILGWTQTMVKVQAFRARGKLRKLMTATPPRTQGDAS
jgi:RNA polymerase sigma-70 factor, ECF subfamily